MRHVFRRIGEVGWWLLVASWMSQHRCRNAGSARMGSDPAKCRRARHSSLLAAVRPVVSVRSGSP